MNGGMDGWMEVRLNDDDARRQEGRRGNRLGMVLRDERIIHKIDPRVGAICVGNLMGENAASLILSDRDQDPVLGEVSPRWPRCSGGTRVHRLYPARVPRDCERAEGVVLVAVSPVDVCDR